MTKTSKNQIIQRPKHPKYIQNRYLGSHQNIQRPKRPKTKSSKNQIIQRPKHPKAKSSNDQNIQKPNHPKTKASKNQIIQRPKRPKYKSSNVHNIQTKPLNDHTVQNQSIGCKNVQRPKHPKCFPSLLESFSWINIRQMALTRRRRCRHYLPATRTVECHKHLARPELLLRSASHRRRTVEGHAGEAAESASRGNVSATVARGAVRGLLQLPTPGIIFPKKLRMLFARFSLLPWAYRHHYGHYGQQSPSWSGKSIWIMEWSGSMCGYGKLWGNNGMGRIMGFFNAIHRKIPK